VTRIEVAAAEDVILRGVNPGIYTLEFSATGAVTLTPARIAVVGGQPPVPPPPGPVPSSLQAEVQSLTAKALAAGGSKTTAAGVSSIYGLVADGVSDSSIAPENALPAVKRATDTVLAAQPDGAAWASWRVSVGAKLTALQQEGALTSKAQYVTALRDVAAGMNAVSGFSGQPRNVLVADPNAALFEGINLAQLIELIRLILEIIKAFQ